MYRDDFIACSDKASDLASLWQIFRGGTLQQRMLVTGKKRPKAAFRPDRGAAKRLSNTLVLIDLLGIGSTFSSRLGLCSSDNFLHMLLSLVATNVPLFNQDLD